MPVFDITAPDGTHYEVTGPDGATEEQALQQVQAQHGRPAGNPNGPQPSILDRAVASPIGRGLHDVVGGALHGAADMATMLPLLSGAKPGVDMVTQAVNKPYEAALARNRNTPGYAAARSDADKRQMPSGFTDQMVAPFLPTIAGAVGAPGGFDTMNANADAQAAAQKDYQQRHPVLSAGGQILGGLLMAPKLSVPKAVPQISPYVPSVSDLKTAARGLYKQVDDSGVRVSTDALNGMADSLQDKIGPRLDPTLHPDATAAFNRVMRYATDAKDVPGPASFTELDNLRKVVGDAAASIKPADRELAKQIRNHLDDFVNNLSSEHLDTSLVDAARSDLTSATGAKGQLAKQIKSIEQNKPGALAARGAAGAQTREQYMALRDQLPQAEAQRAAAHQSFRDENALIEAGPQDTVKALNSARDLWSRARQSEMIQKVLDNAELTASGYTQSGKENAIRAGFRQLAKNDSKMARLSPDVRALVIQVVKGGAVTNTLRNIGRFAPHGPVAAAAGASLGSGLGAMAGGLAGAAGGGGVGAAMLPLIGEFARQGATARTAAAAQEALNTAALGRGLPKRIPQGLLSAPKLPRQLPYGLSLPLIRQRQ